MDRQNLQNKTRTEKKMWELIIEDPYPYSH